MLEHEVRIDVLDTPWEIACKLINAKHEGETIFGQKVMHKSFTSEELRKIGEHLVNYCNVEKGDNEND